MEVRAFLFLFYEFPLKSLPDINQNKLRRLAWVKSKSLVEDYRYMLPSVELESRHVYKRVYHHLAKGGVTNDLDRIFEKSSFFSKSAFHDFEVHNKIGYFLKIFDQMLEQHEIDPERLRKKLAEGRRDWHVIMREIEILRKRLSE